ncbi:hypothetical protein [Aliiroseovarius sp. YM-037]|uniref:hypothetical protein n=1 Tax=Aliiroseovarius sp. YM-037 TaxID=3341728 RepID=UPI003A7FD93E
MKPNFALNLSHDGISLLHRTPGGWHLIGETALDSFDFTETLEFLRQTAVELGGRGLATKLILPNSEILYTEIDAPGPSDAEREEQIKAALADRTPYEVEDLSFDWRAKGAKVQVAAVAKVTLDEAEDFAVEHRFNPVSFVAIPDGDTFAGEPFFGPTGASSTFLERNEKVERDAFPVKIVPLPEAASFKHAEPEKVVEPPSAPPEDPPKDEKPVVDEMPEAVEAEAETSQGGVKSDVQDTVDEEFSSDDEHDDSQEPDQTDDLAEDAAPEPEAAAEPETTPEPEPKVASDPVSEPDPEPKPEKTVPLTAGISRPEKPAEPPRTEGPDSTEETPPSPTSSKPRKRKSKDKDQPVVPSFSSSRTESAEPESAESDDDPVEPLLLSQARLAIVPGNGKGDAPVLGAAIKTPGVTIASPPDLPALSPRKPTEPVVTTSLSSPPPQLDVPASPDISVPAPTPAATSLDSLLGVPKPAPIEGVEPPTPVERPAALTAFGAKRKPAQRGKPPHLALILTLVLLAFLALAAVWSTFVLGDGLSSWFGGGETTTTADVEEGELGEPIDEGEPAETAEVEVAPPMSEEVAQAFYDETGVWLRVPTRPSLPPSPGLDDLYVASIDPPAASHDAIALPTVDPMPNEGKLPQQVNPAPQGTRYELDERGFVIPTAEGAINPDGVPVFAGRPSKITPPRPRSVALPAEALDPIEAAIMATFKPRPRPDDLQERFERAQYGGLTRTELAAQRPAPRPEAPQLAASVDTAPTALAVAQSPAPRHRPDQFAQIIEAAQANIAAAAAAAASSGNSAPAAAASASVAAGQAPSIPTRASVARQATVQNAINLRQLSLIGVYGTSSQRRALLRLRNGRYVKVEVGDRVDGGRVSAIGDSALQYTKGGRNITLQMPDT